MWLVCCNKSIVGAFCADWSEVERTCAHFSKLYGDCEIEVEKI